MTSEVPSIAATDTSDVSRGPLSGLLVADLSRVLAGPYLTQLMGDLGADVIKVESPAGDETRGWTPPSFEGASTYYLGVNRNKRDIVLNFRDPDDLALAHELTRRADIVVENFKPGGLAKYELDYPSVSARNPGVIYASISGFGNGLGAHMPGYDLVVQAASGLMSLTGPADGPAYRSGVSVFDIMTGMHALIGVLAALHHRDSTDEGQHIEVNLLSTALSAMANHSSAFVTTGAVPYRMGNAHPSLFPYEPLPAQDGDIVIVAASDPQFVRLCDALGVPELASDARFASTDDRNRNREDLRPLLVAALEQHTVAEWFETLSAAGIACGPINTIDQGVALAEKLGLAPVVEVGDGDDRLKMIRNPITFSSMQPSYSLRPPRLGQDDLSIRSWLTTRTEESA